MDFLSGLTAISALDGATKLARLNAVGHSIEKNEVAPLVALAGAVRTLNVETNTEYAGLFNGMKDASAGMENMLREMGYLEVWEKWRGSVEASAGEFLEKTGVGPAAELGVQKTLQALDSLEVTEVVQDRLPPVFTDSLNSVSEWLGETWEKPYRIAVPFEKVADLEQQVLKWADEKGVLLTAKRVDYVVGSDYVKGFTTKIPVVGNFSNILCKGSVGVDITNADWIKAGTDGLVLVITFTATPLVAPAVAAGSSLGAVTAQYAIGGSAVGGLTGAIAHGGLKFAEGAASEEILASVGTGALQGAVVGAIGGAASGVFAHRAAVAVQSGINEVSRETVTTAEEVLALKEAQLEDLIEQAKSGAYLSEKAAAGKGSLSRYVERVSDELKEYDGLQQNLKALAGGNVQSGRGRWAEMARARHYHHAGDLKDISVVVDVPNLGKTDIDLLTKSGKWVENKHVEYISLTKDFTTKIDKMAEAVRTGLEVKGVPIQEGIFVNSKRISEAAMEYAKSKGIRCIQNCSHSNMV